jgi:hypothetical protein
MLVEPVKTPLMCKKELPCCTVAAPIMGCGSGLPAIQFVSNSQRLNFDFIFLPLRQVLLDVGESPHPCYIHLEKQHPAANIAIFTFLNL